MRFVRTDHQFLSQSLSSEKEKRGLNITIFECWKWDDAAAAANVAGDDQVAGGSFPVSPSPLTYTYSVNGSNSIVASFINERREKNIIPEYRIGFDSGFPLSEVFKKIFEWSNAEIVERSLFYYIRIEDAVNRVSIAEGIIDTDRISSVTEEETYKVEITSNRAATRNLILNATPLTIAFYHPAQYLAGWQTFDSLTESITYDLNGVSSGRKGFSDFVNNLYICDGSPLTGADGVRSLQDSIRVFPHSLCALNYSELADARLIGVPASLSSLIEFKDFNQIAAVQLGVVESTVSGAEHRISFSDVVDCFIDLKAFYWSDAYGSSDVRTKTNELRSLSKERTRPLKNADGEFDGNNEYDFHAFRSEFANEIFVKFCELIQANFAFEIRFDVTNLVYYPRLVLWRTNALDTAYINTNDAKAIEINSRTLVMNKNIISPFLDQFAPDLPLPVPGARIDSFESARLIDQQNPREIQVSEINGKGQRPNEDIAPDEFYKPARFRSKESAVTRTALKGDANRSFELIAASKLPPETVFTDASEISSDDTPTLERVALNRLMRPLGVGTFQYPSLYFCRISGEVFFFNTYAEAVLKLLSVTEIESVESIEKVTIENVPEVLGITEYFLLRTNEFSDLLLNYEITQLERNYIDDSLVLTVKRIKPAFALQSIAAADLYLEDDASTDRNYFGFVKHRTVVAAGSSLAESEDESTVKFAYDSGFPKFTAIKWTGAGIGAKLSIFRIIEGKKVYVTISSVLIRSYDVPSASSSLSDINLANYAAFESAFRSFAAFNPGRYYIELQTALGRKWQLIDVYEGIYRVSNPVLNANQIVYLDLLDQHFDLTPVVPLLKTQIYLKARYRHRGGFTLFNYRTHPTNFNPLQVCVSDEYIQIRRFLSSSWMNFGVYYFNDTLNKSKNLVTGSDGKSWAELHLFLDVEFPGDLVSHWVPTLRMKDAAGAFQTLTVSGDPLKSWDIQQSGAEYLDSHALIYHSKELTGYLRTEMIECDYFKAGNRRDGVNYVPVIDLSFNKIGTFDPVRENTVQNNYFLSLFDNQPFAQALRKKID